MAPKEIASVPLGVVVISMFPGYIHVFAINGIGHVPHPISSSPSSSRRDLRLCVLEI